MIFKDCKILNSKFEYVSDYPINGITYSASHRALVPTNIKKDVKRLDDQTVKLIKYYNVNGDLQVLKVGEHCKVYDAMQDKFSDQPKKILVYSDIFMDKLQVLPVESIEYTFGTVKEIKAEKGSLFVDNVLIQGDE